MKVDKKSFIIPCKARPDIKRGRCDWFAIKVKHVNFKWAPWWVPSNLHWNLVLGQTPSSHVPCGFGERQLCDILRRIKHETAWHPWVMVGKCVKQVQYKDKRQGHPRMGFQRKADPFKQNADPPLKTPKAFTWICGMTRLCILRLAKSTKGGKTLKSPELTHNTNVSDILYLPAPETCLNLVDNWLVTLWEELCLSNNSVQSSCNQHDQWI